jgi:hypothetical protein
MTISLKKENFALSTLDGGISNSATSLTVASGDGSKFPATGNFRAVLWSASYSDPAEDPNAEIVEATLDAGDVFDISRAQESTSAQAWSSGDKFALTLTKGVIDEIESEIANHAHDDRYYTETEMDSGQLDNRYYTETEVDTVRGHNGESVLGSSFSITAANGTYEDTGLSISLPTAGTYLLYANVRYAMNFSAGATGFLAAKLYNITDAADVSNSERMLHLLSSTGQDVQGTAPLTLILTVAAAKTIKLYAKRDSATTWTTSVIGAGSDGKTVLGYKRIS